AAALPPRTTSFGRWAERLAEHARSETTLAERDFWTRAAEVPGAPLPVDLPGSAGTEGGVRTVTVSLTTEATRALLQEVPQAYRTQINDVLLAALVRAFAGWTGERSLLVDLEGHGREDLFEGVDLTRTVGWFTSIFPVRLEADPAADPGETIRSVKEQLRAVPGKGIGYGLLRYLSGDAELAERLAAAPRAEVAFNYLGQWDAGTPGEPLFRMTREPAGPSRAPANPRRHLLEVNAAVGGGELRVSWTYGTETHREETVRALAGRYTDALRELIEHCRSAGAGGYTPSDFPVAGLDQKKLDRLMGKLTGSRG
ncbi:MAG TPA: condensation domain-containing protein, partial [Longimicrobiaceae bacterium]